MEIKKSFKKVLTSLLSAAMLIVSVPTIAVAETSLTLEAKDGELNETVLYAQIKNMYGDAIGTLDQAEFNIVRKSDNAEMIKGLTLTNAPDTKFTNDTYIVNGRKGENKWVQTGQWPWQGENQVSWTDLEQKEMDIRVYHELTVNATYDSGNAMTQSNIVAYSGANVGGGSYTDTELSHGATVNFFEDSTYTIRANTAIAGYKFVSLFGKSESEITLTWDQINSSTIDVKYEMLPCDVVINGIFDENGNPVDGIIALSGMNGNQIPKEVETQITVSTTDIWYDLVSVDVKDTFTSTPIPTNNNKFTATNDINSVSITATVKPTNTTTIKLVDNGTTASINSHEGSRIEAIDSETYKVETGKQYSISAKGYNVNDYEAFTVIGKTLNGTDVAGDVITAESTNEVIILTKPISVKLSETNNFDYWASNDWIADIAVAMGFEGINENGEALSFANIATFGILNTKISNLPDIAQYTMLADGTYSTTIKVSYKGPDGTVVKDSADIKFVDNRLEPLKDISGSTFTFNDVNDENSLYNTILNALMPEDVKSASKYSLSMNNEQIIKIIRENPENALVLNAVYTETEDTKYKPVIKEVSATIEQIYYRVPVVITSEKADFTGGAAVVEGTEYENGDTILMYHDETIEVSAKKSGSYRPYVNGIYESTTIEGADNSTKVEIIYTMDSIITRKDVANGTMTFVGVDGNPVSIIAKPGDKIELLITPDNSGSAKYYVQSVNVVRDSNLIGFDEPVESTVIYENDAARVSFSIEATRSHEYKIWAYTAPAALVLKDSETLNWNKYEQDKYNALGNLKETIYNLVLDTEKSFPVIAFDDSNIKIEYKAAELPESISGVSLGSLGGAKYIELTGSINDINAKVEKLENDIISGIEALRKLGINIDIEELLKDFHPFGYSDKEEIRITWNGEGNETDLKNIYPTLTATTTLNILDDRHPTVISAQDFGFVYGDVLTHEDLVDMAKVNFDSQPATGEYFIWSSADIKFSKDLLTADAGEYEITVSYIGNEDFKPSETKIKVAIAKAKSSISTESLSVEYGDAYTLNTSSTPDGIDYITAIAGVKGDVSGYISIHMPESVKARLDKDITIAGTTFNPYEELIDAFKTSLTNGELQNKLNDLLRLISDNTDYNLSFVEKLISVLELNPGKTAIEMTFDELPSDAGVYAVAVITADKNYETSYDIGYLTIAPAKGEVRFNKTDKNNTFKYLTAQTYDFGAKFFFEDKEMSTDYMQMLFVGATYDEEGNEIGTYSSSEAPRVPGLYTQTAAVIGGNYYSEPITRTYVILPQSLSGEPTELDVEILPSNNILHTTDYEVRAFLYDENGNVIDGEVEITYIGLNADGDIIYNSTEKPTALGIYQVIAIYKGEPNKYLPTANLEETLIIYKEATYINVIPENSEIVYDGQPHGVEAKVYNENDEEVCDADVLYVGFDINNIEIYRSTEKPVLPGYYKAIATYAGDDTHFASMNVESSFIIHKEAVIIMNPPYQAVKYDGHPRGVEAIVTDYLGNPIDGAEATIKYVEIKNGSEILMDNAPVMPGNYKAVATYVGQKDTISATATIRIYELSTYVRISPNLTSVVYDGYPHTVSAEVYDENHNLIATSTDNPEEVSIKYYSLTDEMYVESPVDAGIYHITAEFKGDETVYGSSNILGVMVIKPSDALIKVKINDITTHCGEKIDNLKINKTSLLSAIAASDTFAIEMNVSGLSDREILMLANIENIVHEGNENGEGEHAITLKLSDELLESLERNYTNELDVISGIHKVEHNYQTTVVDPTCDDEGYTLHTCSCGHSFKDNIVEAHGHEMGEWEIIEPATCDKEGKVVRTCKHEHCNHKEEGTTPKLSEGCTVPGKPVEPNPTPSNPEYTERPKAGVAGDNIGGLLAGGAMIGLGLIGMFFYFSKKKEDDEKSE